MEEPPRLQTDSLAILSTEYEIMPETSVTSIPGAQPLELPSDCINSDLINYSDVSSDAIFDYRTVEIPLALAQLLPRRNFCESEWRTFGVCMSPGWENYDRRPCELHVLWFRRPKPSVPIKELEKIWASEIAAERKLQENSHFISRLEKVYIFPMFAFDNFKTWKFEVESENIKNFHVLVLNEAEKFLRKPRLRFQPSGG